LCVSSDAIQLFLFPACESGHAEVAKRLLDAGVSMITHDGWSCADIAHWFNNDAVVAVLKESHHQRQAKRRKFK
jgi:hypothetical protein